MSFFLLYILNLSVANSRDMAWMLAPSDTCQEPHSHGETWSVSKCWVAGCLEWNLTSSLLPYRTSWGPVCLVNHNHHLITIIIMLISVSNDCLPGMRVAKWSFLTLSSLSRACCQSTCQLVSPVLIENLVLEAVERKRESFSRVSAKMKNYRMPRVVPDHLDGVRIRN